jgi:peptidoglycan glycosyltransferase
MKLFSIVLFFVTQVTYANLNLTKELRYIKKSKGLILQKNEREIDLFRTKITDLVYKEENWIEEFYEDGEKIKVNYTINFELNEYIKKLLSQFNTMFTSVIVIDNNNGEILSAVDYQGEKKNFSKSSAFQSTHPAASIFKVITAADLLTKNKIDNWSLFSFSGRSTTLYKYQLKKDRPNRWSKIWSFNKAFAMSNNVIFGRAAMENSNPKSLQTMARKFGFNEVLMDEIELDQSSVKIPTSEYEFAEMASGFNKDTMMSPLHGAVIASIVANDGIYKKPILVSDLQSNNKKIWKNKSLSEVVLSKEVSDKLSLMMAETVKNGTAKRAFRQERKLLNDIDVGGKTGSITGGEPYGKRDWFVAYARPRFKSNDKGISICVMIVNGKKWYIKSPYLAKNIINYYYNEL